MNHSVFFKFGIFMMFISSTSLIELVTLYEDTHSITLTISQIFLKNKISNIDKKNLFIF